MPINPDIRSSMARTIMDSAAREGNVATENSIESLPITGFLWGAGIECSFLPHLGVDQFKWTQHDRFWREDLVLAKEQLGISHLRYAFPWHVLEPQRGTFDWSYADERMEEFERLAIKPVLDVMHFGTPLWLKQAVGDPEFPEALEEYTHAIVERYCRSVQLWCPCNEPSVCALFSGDFGFWPPHSRKWRGYMPVLSRIAQAVSRSIRVVRRVMPEATVLLCDNVENFKTRHESLQVEVRRRNLRRFLVLDLITGRLDRTHPLFPWVTAYGLSELDLNWFSNNPQRPDVLGLDYYPHSDWQLEMVGNSVRQSRSNSPAGLYGIANAYYQRYGLPMMLTETSVEGQPINREIWLESTVEDARRLREEGIPMLGYFWWPMIDQVDWDGALTHRIGKVHQVGLFQLVRQPDGQLARRGTSLVKLFRELATSGEARVGKLEQVVEPTETWEDQGPPIGVATDQQQAASTVLVELPTPTAPPRSNGKGHNNGNGNGNGHSETAT
ncbi:MAG: family 1 glycosylhydrolase, partial [Bacillota bacterium]